MIDFADIETAVAQHGEVARVVVAQIAGSTPRDVGASMLVWEAGQRGTIGGGTLEFTAAETARGLIGTTKTPLLSRHPLGPSLGQCCGGSVSLVTEVFTSEKLDELRGQSAYLRRVDGERPVPLSLERDISLARNQGAAIETRLQSGWFVEPFHLEKQPLWIWGAGHVGRAMISTFAPLPDFNLTWIDTCETRFPAHIPSSVTDVANEHPASLAKFAPSNARHLIVTYSHALDLELCHQLLSHSFGSVGLIGSATKWARFRKRLAELGHSAAQIGRIDCPIGDPSLGKHPQAIAISVASTLLQDLKNNKARKDRTA